MIAMPPLDERQRALRNVLAAGTRLQETDCHGLDAAAATLEILQLSELNPVAFAESACALVRQLLLIVEADHPGWWPKFCTSLAVSGVAA